jgi:cellulose synthase/poly-beta-1,6-N-acetylglucosamine synthase-like glycosyltransferase
MFSIYILLAVALIALIDFVPKVFNAFKKPVPVITRFNRKPDFLIMPTVYGDIKYLDNIKFLKKYPKNVLICTSNHESEQFYGDLRRICKKYGFKYAVCTIPVKNGQPLKNAYSIYKGLFTRKQLPMKVSTSCILIDADTYAKDNVNNLVRAFLASDAEIASLRCEVAVQKTVMQQLQGLEYTLAMDNRRMDPWLTSGACNISSAALYRKIFASHSDFFAGGDIEIGKLAYTSGYIVKHIDFTFYTDAPATFKDWFNQRIIWYAGGFRHYIMSIHKYGWYHFFLLFYNAVLIYLLLPIRWLEVLFFPQLLILLLIIGWIYNIILTVGKGWKLVYLLMPFYSFIQTMIIVPFGIARYILLSFKSRDLGKFKGMPNVIDNGFGTRMLNGTLSYATAALLLYVAFYFMNSRIQFWAISSL